MENLVYLFYLMPIIFIMLSRWYMLKFNKLKGTGKIPRIIDAKRRQTLFLCLAILSILLILIITQYQDFR